MTVLVTGAAGFIGYSLAARLLRDGESVYGIDNLCPYYDVALKEARLALLRRHPGFRFAQLDIADRAAMAELFGRERFAAIVHLAAQVGVRYSLEHPLSYVDSNLVGFAHILEGARAQQVEHLLFASSSSVYGANRKLPFSEEDNVDHPITLYAATKKANELTAHSYAHLYGLPCTGLRFFTVYGPWVRPDMALFKFARAIVAGEKLPVFNAGRMVRDFTYIDDVVEAVVRLMALPPAAGGGADADDGVAPYCVFNIGNGRPVELLDYIRALEDAFGRKAELQLLPMQPGDMAATLADISRLERAVGYRPTTPLATGVRRFAEWYLEHYGIEAPGSARSEESASR
jgi:UDP-glucuronate 4-epimerase